MRIVILFMLFTLTVVGCRISPKQAQYVDDSEQPSIPEGKQFFEYDHIDHYFKNFDGAKLPDLLESLEESNKDSLLSTVLLDDFQGPVPDLSFIDVLESTGFVKKQVSYTLFPQIDRIFVEKTVTNHSSTTCTPIYRDILVFRKREKITGVAKICFECLNHQITGTSATTQNFGQDGDYEKLKLLLHSRPLRSAESLCGREFVDKKGLFKLQEFSNLIVKPCRFYVVQEKQYDLKTGLLQHL